MSPLDPATYRDIVRRALAEDVGRGDVTTEATVAATARARGRFIMKSPGVVAGLDVAAETFRQVDAGLVLAAAKQDGVRCEAGAVLATLEGSARGLLVAERTALNFLQHLSGIATLTRRFVDVAEGRIVVLDTRKTTPTLRALEKYAVHVGGGTNHRFSLEDGILIKDNHVALSGGVSNAVALMRQAGQDFPVEVEVGSLDDVDVALESGADVLLLDNMPLASVREAVRRCRGRARTEVSGGVTLETLPGIAASGADYVSVGALTHSAPACDISFMLEPL